MVLGLGFQTPSEWKNDVEALKQTIKNNNDGVSSDSTSGATNSNDNDIDGGSFSVTSVSTTGTTGVVTWTSSGSFTYDPRGRFDELSVGESATDTFTYTITGGSTATVTITITGENDAPFAVDQDVMTDEDTPVGVPVTYSDFEDDPITFTYDHVGTNGGTITRLTAGDVSCDLTVISPDGRKIIFTQTEYDVKERPYQNIKHFMLDLETMQHELILEGNFLGNVYFSPDGNKLLVEGGSSLFNNLGVNVPEGTFPSDFDTQAYIYDLVTKQAEAITKDFDPEIGSSYWINDNEIYFNTTDKSCGHLYK